MFCKYVCLNLQKEISSWKNNNRIRQIVPGEAEGWPGGARSGCQAWWFSHGPVLSLLLAHITISCYEYFFWRGIVLLTAATLKCWRASFHLAKAKKSSMAKPNHNHFNFCDWSLQILTFLKFYNPRLCILDRKDNELEATSYRTLTSHCSHAQILDSLDFKKDEID